MCQPCHSLSGSYGMVRLLCKTVIISQHTDYCHFPFDSSVVGAILSLRAMRQRNTYRRCSCFHCMRTKHGTHKRGTPTQTQHTQLLCAMVVGNRDNTHTHTQHIEIALSTRKASHLPRLHHHVGAIFCQSGRLLVEVGFFCISLFATLHIAQQKASSMKSCSSQE